MKLSTLYTAVPEYIEFAWVTEPNAAAQSIPANTITTLTLNAEVADTANLVSAPGTSPAAPNQFILPSGTYYFEAYTRTMGLNNVNSILLLYDVTNAAYVRRGNPVYSFNGYGANSQEETFQQPYISSTIVLSSATTFDLRVISGAATKISQNGGNYTGQRFTVSTANTDQRTTIKLWKLK